MPERSVMCASHELPPNVGDSTNADTTPRWVSRMAVARAARSAASAETSAGWSYVTAPYDSMNSNSTSAFRTRDNVPSIDGLGGRARDRVLAARASQTSRAWCAYVFTTGAENCG